MKAKRLAHQVVLVTGAARRIGRAIALALAEEGAYVAVHFRSSKAEADAVVAEISSAGCRAIACGADLTKKSEIALMMRTVEDAFGRLDILVNNAGMFAPAQVEEMSEEQWDTMLDTNVKAPFLCAQASLGLLRRGGHGRIINIASIGGLLAWPRYTHYCVSKAGVIMMTRCLARALAPTISVNCVAPGTIQFAGEPLDQDYVQRAPLGTTGRGEDIAQAVLFLATSSFITGQVIVVDGGRTLS